MLLRRINFQQLLNSINHISTIMLSHIMSDFNKLFSLCNRGEFFK